MLDNWLYPVSEDLVPDPKMDQCLGAKIKIFTQGRFPNLNGVQVALLSLEEAEGDAVRQALYALSFPFDQLQIADLGSLRKNTAEFIMPVLIELHESGIIPLIIGKLPEQVLLQYQGLQHELQNINMIWADSRIPLSVPDEAQTSELLNQLVFHEKSKLFNLSILGCQTHYISPVTYRLMEELLFEYVRLGAARDNLSELEPLLRYGDLFALNLAALKQSEAPGQVNAGPSGFLIEEACQICRYAGMSDKLKSFGLYGFQAALDQNQQTAQAISQLVWYFLDGVFNRKGDFPISTEGMLEYMVHLKQLDYTLTFWKSQRSGRWWLQVPSQRKDQQAQTRHRLLPCTYNDYKMATQDELGDRLVNAFKRFG
jgi:formiminoglutamase